MNLTFSEESTDPAAVIKVVHGPINNTTTLDTEDVAIRFLAWPINPQDLMQIAGRYPVKPVYKHDGAAIAGNDGVAIVERIGPAVRTLSPGDHVLPKRHGLGTWREYAVLPASSLIKLHGKVDPVSASILKMGVLPAFFLVEDVRPLRPGDWIVVNAGRGVIPQMVVQFAKLRGCRTVVVVREHETLPDHGDIVVTEEALAQHGSEADRTLAQLVEQQRIVLALDAVFGASGARLAHLLGHSGIFCNYGSLGGASEVINLTQQLVFWKQITFKNFRLSQQLALRSDGEQERLLGWCADLFEQGVLVAPPVDILKLDRGEMAAEKVRLALRKASSPARGTTKKQVIILQ